MGIVSYAQNFEDVVLWRALGHVKDGFYIDVGAQDPIVDSVSRAFYENGWRGIHVEAAPVYANRLRGDRPDELVFQAALSDERGTMSFYEIPKTGLSTGEKSIADHHASIGYAVVETVVPCLTLADIFEQAGKRDIHWLKIDVEGMERKVLAGWKGSLARPWIVVVESTYPNSQTPTHKAWEKMLLGHGYTHAYFDGLSRYYVSDDHKDLRKQFGVPPNIFDSFSIAASSAYSVPLTGRLRALERKVAAGAGRRRRLVTQARNSAGLVEQLSRELLEQKAEVRLAYSEQRRLVQEQFSLREMLVEQSRSSEQSAREHAHQLEAARDRERDLSELRARSDAAATDVQERLNVAMRREQELALALATAQADAIAHARQQQHEHDERVRELGGALHLAQQRSAMEIGAVQHALESVHEEFSRHREAALLALDQMQREHGMQREAAQQAFEQIRSDHARQLEAAEQALDQSRQEHSREREAAQRALDQMQRVHSLEREAAREALDQVQQGYARERESAQRALDQILREHAREREGIQQLLASVQQEFAAHRDAAQQALNQAQQDAAAERKAAQEGLSRLQLQNARNSETAQLALLQVQQELAGAREKAGQLAADLARTKSALAAIVNSPSWRATSPFRAAARLLRGAGAAESYVPAEHPLGQAASIQEETDGPVMKPMHKQRSSPPAASMNELLALNDLRFVESAYRALLGRPADTQGTNFYLARLRAGIPKRQIAAEMRLSAEGRIHASALPGLDAVVRQYKLRQLPLLGPVFRLATWTEERSGLAREFGAFADHMQDFNLQVIERLERLEQVVSASQRLVESTINLVSAESGLVRARLEEVLPIAASNGGQPEQARLRSEPVAPARAVGLTVPQIVERIYAEIAAEGAGER